MTTFDSPVEALAFEYASFGVFAVVNNVWAWILTAAATFWRIRVSGDGHGRGLLEELTTSSKSETESGHLEPETNVSGPVEEESVRLKETEVSEPLTCGYGVTKGKLTMYYYDYDIDGDGEKCDDGELTDGGSLGNCGEWWERWEKVVRIRNGDDGWYRYVDLTVINGNVVRLWDDNGNSNGGRFGK